MLLTQKHACGHILIIHNNWDRNDSILFETLRKRLLLSPKRNVVNVLNDEWINKCALFVAMALLVHTSHSATKTVQMEWCRLFLLPFVLVTCHEWKVLQCIYTNVVAMGGLHSTRAREIHGECFRRVICEWQQPKTPIITYLNRIHSQPFIYHFHS